MYYRLQFLIDIKSEHIQHEEKIFVEAGKIVAKMYNALRKQYRNSDYIETAKASNVLCIRLVFCFYAEHADIFRHLMFYDYMKDVPVSKRHRELKDLFRILNMPDDERDEYDDPKLLAFPYVNGGLFADNTVKIPAFTQEIVDIILNEASRGFDWSEISPTIFGAVFESTMNPETRRAGGLYYTSLVNIHKVIDQLFLNDLKAEPEEIKLIKTEKIRRQKLQEFRKKLSSLTFLDPAAGSGNFLTETYISLRRLENDALFAETGSQTMFQIEELIQVSLEFLPLKSYANIIESNAFKLLCHNII